MDSFGWWLQSVLAAPLDTNMHANLDPEARFVIDFGVHAAFDPSDPEDIVLMRAKLEKELGLVLEPKEIAVPMLTVTKKQELVAVR